MLIRRGFEPCPDAGPGRAVAVGNFDGDSVQGYLLSEAVPGERIGARIQAWHRKRVARMPRHFHQQTLPGIPNTVDLNAISGRYLALRE